VQPGEHKRKPNGILGLLCRLHFPGLVMHAGVLEPAYTWDHYMASPDATDREGRNFNTKARRVVGELWDFYRCEEGYEARANELAHQACYKLVKDMHYEARIQAVIVYCADYEKRSVKKPAARDIFLTRDQYLRVPPNWCANKAECWSMMVDKWISEDWARQHALCRDVRIDGPRAGVNWAFFNL